MDDYHLVIIYDYEEFNTDLEFHLSAAISVKPVLFFVHISPGAFNFKRYSSITGGNNMMVIGCTRVSTEEQASIVASLQAQTEKLRAYAAC